MYYSLEREIRVLLQEKRMDELKTIVNQVDYLEVVRVLERLPIEDCVVIFRLLNKEEAIEVFEQLELDIQQLLISGFADERAIEMFSALEPDDRVRLMDELPAKVAKKLLVSLTEEEKRMTSILMGYEAETAGRMMTPKYMSLKKGLTVEEALNKIRAIGRDIETLYYLYVTNDKRQLEGVVTLKELVTSDPSEKIENIIDEDIVSVRTSDDQEDVANVLKDRDIIAVPVVDSENRLVGVITIDDAMDVIEEETTADIFDKAGLIEFSRVETGRSTRLIKGNLWEVWRVRIPFLLITLAGGLLAGLLIESFEDTLEAITAVAFFIPVVMDMGGNVGTQSSTIFTRALVLGHINMKSFFKHWIREVGIGFSMGIVLGILAGLIAALWQGNVVFGLVVGVSLVLTITLATSLGFLVPYILVKLGFDQAAGSDPFITTIKDITGLFIYFFLVMTFMEYIV